MRSAPITRTADVVSPVWVCVYSIQSAATINRPPDLLPWSVITIINQSAFHFPCDLRRPKIPGNQDDRGEGKSGDHKPNSNYLDLDEISQNLVPMSNHCINAFDLSLIIKEVSTSTQLVMKVRMHIFAPKYVHTYLRIKHLLKFFCYVFYYWCQWEDFSRHKSKNVTWNSPDLNCLTYCSVLVPHIAHNGPGYGIRLQCYRQTMAG